MWYDIFLYNLLTWLKLLVLSCCCCLPTPMTLASGGSSMFMLVVHQPASLASSAVTPAGSVHKSRGDNVVRMWMQLKRWCGSCVWMLQRGLASTLCKYDLRKGDLFVLSWARVRQVRRGSLSSELLVCGGGVRSILLLPLVARCLLETIDVCIWFILFIPIWPKCHLSTFYSLEQSLQLPP